MPEREHPAITATADISKIVILFMIEFETFDEGMPPNAGDGLHLSRAAGQMLGPSSYSASSSWLCPCHVFDFRIRGQNLLECSDESAELCAAIDFLE
jgi:hypothetical protein